MTMPRGSGGCWIPRHDNPATRCCRRDDEGHDMRTDKTFEADLVAAHGHDYRRTSSNRCAVP